jgi:glycine cleavage system pyridoxal-binding protein P
MKAGPRIAVAALLVLLLAAVFASYLGPHMVVDLASRVWSCF